MLGRAPNNFILNGYQHKGAQFRRTNLGWNQGAKQRSLGAPGNLREGVRNPRTAAHNNGSRGFPIFAAQAFSWRASLNTRALASRFWSSGVGVGTNPPVESSPALPESMTRYSWDLKHRL